MNLLRLTALLVLVLAGTLLAVRALNPLPPLEGRSVSAALTGTETTSIGSAIAPMAATHPGLSGVHPLADALDAFAVRMLLANAAERSLDVQYYIWRRDMTGTLLLDTLRRAVDRGVRVRLLLDDNNTAGLDDLLAAVDAQPNVEVRLFNPFTIRSVRALGFLTDFPRLNRRMHNKSLTVDNQATVIGGRNVGDEYFDAAAAGALSFADLDVLAVGPVVREVSADLDRYWASVSALDLVTPHFVPTAAGVDAFARLAGSGVRIRVLVNSLEATDVDAVHSGYARWRVPLLEHGVVLYETRLSAPPPRGTRGARLGSSGSSLHAKVFAVDEARMFVGSFNFDPRSANLNTELGFVIESSALARRTSDLFDERLPAIAYEVHAENGHVFWTEQRGGNTIRHDVEPGTTALQRTFVWLLSLLPLDRFL